jgi:hypothetical protein
MRLPHGSQGTQVPVCRGARTDRGGRTGRVPQVFRAGAVLLPAVIALSLIAATPADAAAAAAAAAPSLSGPGIPEGPCRLDPAPGSTTGIYHAYMADPATGVAYDIAMDNPQICQDDLGPVDGWVARSSGSDWTFDVPPVPAGFRNVPATGVDCQPVIEYAVRGSLEDLDEGPLSARGQLPFTKFWSINGLANDHGAGVIAAGVHRELEAALGAAVPLYADYYPADDLLALSTVTTLAGPIKASVRTGIEQAVRDLNHLVTACPNSRLALVGYSQGALVLRRALADPGLSPQIGGARASVALFGDPEFRATEGNDPNAPGYRPELAPTSLLGGYNPQSTGVMLAFEPALFPSSPSIPARLRVFSWCHHDAVCQGLPDAPVAHLTYGSADSYAAAQAVAAHLSTTSAPGLAPVRVAGRATTVTPLIHACASRDGKQQVAVRLADAGPAGSAPVRLSLSVGYRIGSTYTEVSSQQIRLPGGAVRQVTGSLPSVPGATVEYTVSEPDVPNPLAWKDSGRTEQLPQVLYSGTLPSGC